MAATIVVLALLIMPWIAKLPGRERKWPTVGLLVAAAVSAVPCIQIVDSAIQTATVRADLQRAERLAREEQRISDQFSAKGREVSRSIERREATKRRPDEPLSHYRSRLRLLDSEVDVLLIEQESLGRRLNRVAEDYDKAIVGKD